MTRTYSEMIKYNSYEDRLHYLQITEHRIWHMDSSLKYLFYKSDSWRRARDFVILRDNGCDLGLLGFEIKGKLFVHHICPISSEDILSDASVLYDPNNLICVSMHTHNLIHYPDGAEHPALVDRMHGDTRLW